MSLLSISVTPTPLQNRKPKSKLPLPKADLLIHPIGELATPCVENGPARKKQMHEIRRVKNAAIAVRKGVIIEAGPADDVLSKIETDAATRKIEAPNKLVTPGLIDPHTHLVFGGNRANEFLMRCQGKTYAEIASSGGGIVASMRATRNATVDELVETGLYRLK